MRTILTFSFRSKLEPKPMGKHSCWCELLWVSFWWYLLDSDSAFIIQYNLIKNWLCARLSFCLNIQKLAWRQDDIFKKQKDLWFVREGEKRCLTTPTEASPKLQEKRRSQGVMRESALLGYMVKKLLGLVGWHNFQLTSVPKGRQKYCFHDIKTIA